MILKELHDLYERLLTAGENIPRRGFYSMSLSFRIVLTPEGQFVRIEDARKEVQVKKTKSVKTELRTDAVLMPGRAKPSGAGINPCFLGDNASYLLGYCDAAAPEKALRCRECFAGLRDKHLRMEELVNSPAYSAVCRFLEKWNPDASDALAGVDAEIFKTCGVFRIQGSLHDVHEEKGIVDWWLTTGEKLWWGGDPSKTSPSGICLITNEESPIALTHEPAIQGVQGAQSTGAKLVSFNCKAFESYGKEQSVNAPVSSAASFAYSNALNYLLSSKQHCMRIGETTVVFWTDAPRESAAMNALAMYAFDSFSQAEDNQLRAQVEEELTLLAKGEPLRHSDDLAMKKTRFFILGLSPNAARLSVRFYQESTFGEFVERLRRHFEGLRLQPRGSKYQDPEIIRPYNILLSSVREAKEIPPLYAGALMRAILFGTPYPDTIAMAMIRRFKADGNISYIRCAYLKAWLNRSNRINPIKTMLDTTNTDPGYLLGRLFAVLTKTQEEALPGINKTIRDSYYASASATPGSVFPRLMRLYTHHIAKLKEGHKVIRERQMQEIIDLLGTTFPSRLNLQEQGAFALGFYQQTQSFYTKATPQPES